MVADRVTAFTPLAGKAPPTEVDVEELAREWQKLGYFTSDLNLVSQLGLALADMGNPNKEAVSCLILDGPPGTGKTFLAKTLVKYLHQLHGVHVEFVQFQFTVGVSRDVMMHDIDIAAVVHAQINKEVGAAITKDDLIIPGVLQVALEASHQRPVVLLLDEVDKAKPYVDSMLLQLLEDGAVAHPTRRGHVIKGDKTRLFVVITKNNERLLSEPLMRRGRSIYMQWPLEDTEVRMVSSLVRQQMVGQQQLLRRFDVEALAKTLVTMANRVRKLETVLQKVPSSPELAQAAMDVMRVPKELRGVVAARSLFKYANDYTAYQQKCPPGNNNDTEVSEKHLKWALSGH